MPGVEHAEAWDRIAHALGEEQCFPFLMRDQLGAHGATKRCGEGLCEIIGRDAAPVPEGLSHQPG